jgi:hypothetical protein
MAVASLAAHAQSDPPKVPLFDDLGRHHYAITTATPLAQRYFDQGLRLYYPDHPGANHFYIHAVEAVQPERALAAAERLAALMPGAGHIVHMPGHIYVRVGRYLDAIQANEHAIHADEIYIRDHRPGSGMYTAGYYPHNYDFLAFAASMIGRSRQSIDAAEKLPAIAPAEMLRAPGMTFLQHHRTRHLQMKVRFSRWHDILATPAPDEDLPHAVAMWNYARGRALAARGDTAQAKVAPRTPARSGGGSDTRRAAARVQYVGCNPRDRDRGADRAHCGIYERLRGGGRAPSRGGEARGCVDRRRATRLVGARPSGTWDSVVKSGAAGGGRAGVPGRSEAVSRERLVAAAALGVVSGH